MLRMLLLVYSVDCGASSGLFKPPFMKYKYVYTQEKLTKTIQ